jgi:HEAT repeat protein
MPTRARSAAVLCLLVARQPAPGQVPDVLTRQWLEEAFLSKPEPSSGAAAEAAERAKWIAVRDRPETVTLLIQIADDAKKNPLVRGNAVLSIGATGQLGGYEYLISRWNRMTGNDRDRTIVIFALGSGRRPDRELASIALQKLREIIETGDKAMRVYAAKSLGDIGSAGARNILQSRLKSEPDSVFRRVIDRELRKPLK